jgi:hypothetical protein
VRMHLAVRADASSRLRGRGVSAQPGPRRLGGISTELHKGSSNAPLSLLTSPLLEELIVCLLHFVVWAVIGETFFDYACRCYGGNYVACCIAKPISKLL